MFSHKINYPPRIDTLQQFNIFFDYVIHGLIDECCAPIEFHGVHTHSSECVGEVIVDVHLKIANKDQGVASYLRDEIQKVLGHLKGGYLTKLPLTLSKIRVNLLVETYDLPEHIKIKTEMEEKNMFIPEVKEIVHRKSKRGEFFTVIWKDSTQTTVKLMEGDTSDEYTAYLYALGKKLFGNKGEGRKFVAEKKAVFEDRMAKKSAEKARQRRQQAIQQSLEAEDLPDISEQVYDAMFVAPCMVSRAMFKRNK